MVMIIDEWWMGSFISSANKSKWGSGLVFSWNALQKKHLLATEVAKLVEGQSRASGGHNVKKLSWGRCYQWKVDWERKRLWKWIAMCDLLNQTALELSRFSILFTVASLFPSSLFWSSTWLTEFPHWVVLFPDCLKSACCLFNWMIS